MPNGTQSFAAAARPTSSPMRVILNAVRLITLGELAEVGVRPGLGARRDDAGTADADVEHALGLADARGTRRP